MNLIIFCLENFDNFISQKTFGNPAKLLLYKMVRVFWGTFYNPLKPLHLQYLFNYYFKVIYKLNYRISVTYKD